MTPRRTEKAGRENAGDAERKARFSRDLWSESRLKELRGKHVSGGLSVQESLELLLQGNAEHAAALKGAPMTPHQRYLKILAGQADYAIVRCSDSRVHRTDSESDQTVGIHIAIAGNVIPGRKTASRDEIIEVIGRIRPDGAVLCEAHCSCGAVGVRNDWVNDGMKPTGSGALDTLLRDVMGPTPSDNGTAQLSKLRELPLGQRASGLLMYDWGHGGISIVSSTPSPLVELLVSQFNLRHSEADPDGKLASRITKQAPHAVVVGSNLLPFSIGTITRAQHNEVFNTTGSEGGLDDFDEASILYAVEHLHVRHIPFVAPGNARNSGKINGMFDGWEQDLRSMMVGGKPLLAEMLDSGELVITRLRYDLQTGRLCGLAGKA